MPDIIALELDLSQEEVIRIIQKENSEERRKITVKKASGIPLLSRFYFNELVNINKAIQLAQSRMWKALKVGPEFRWQTRVIDGKGVSKKPQLDILGYTISIATKMTALAKPDQIIIGQLVYDVLDDKRKSSFRLLPLSPVNWNYFSSNTGDIYHLYVSLTENESPI